MLIYMHYRLGTTVKISYIVYSYFGEDYFCVIFKNALSFQCLCNKP